jgi:hypothetical protein
VEVGKGRSSGGCGGIEKEETGGGGGGGGGGGLGLGREKAKGGLEVMRRERVWPSFFVHFRIAALGSFKYWRLDWAGLDLAFFVPGVFLLYFLVVFGWFLPHARFSWYFLDFFVCASFDFGQSDDLDNPTDLRPRSWRSCYSCVYKQ